ncbi:MAG: CDP-glucose 4,6-dehydratase [Ginsengibacter sp.]
MENVVAQNFIFESFRNKKIFITGHTGFKGSWLISILKKFDAEIKGYSLNPVYSKNLFSILNDDGLLCNSIIHDIRDENKIEEEIVNFEPDFIFHLAAQSLVRYSYEYPLETFQINTGGTANVLNACRNLSKKCAVIIITSDKVYKNIEQEYAYREDDRLGGYDPYSASKAAAEIVIDSYRSSYFNIENGVKPNVVISSARAGNVIGGGDWAKDRIIPDIINALENRKDIIIRNPNSIRPWQHVLDPLMGYLMLAANLYNNPEKFSGAWNFGPYSQDTFSVRELVERIIKLWGGGNYKISDEEGPHEANLLKLNIDKSVNVLGWKPLLSGEKSIEWAISWYKQPLEKRKEFTFQQIQKIFDLEIY